MADKEAGMPGVHKFRNRNMCMILYPDTNPKHIDALDYIRKNFEYGAMYHNEDVDEEGVQKGPHWHVMVRFKQARWNTAVADQIGVELNLLRELGSIEAYGTYMTHANDPDKHQYPIEEMEGPLAHIVAKAMAKDDTEDESVTTLIDLIESVESTLTYTQLIRLACKHGLYSFLRRNGYMFCKVLDEHNYQVIMASQGE